MPGPGAGVTGRDGFINRPCPCRLPPPRRSSYCMCSSHCMQVNLQTYGYTHWCERAAAGTASSPLRVLRASKLDGSPGLLRWRCCHGGGFPLQYARACFMTHSFLTLGFISYDDVYITNGVYIFIRKILWSCTVVFLRMSVSFTMYLVRDDLINKWNRIEIWTKSRNLLKTPVHYTNLQINCHFKKHHYNDVIMGMIASQITSLTIVYSTVYSGAVQRKHQSSASQACVRGIHGWPMNSPHKEPVTWKMFPFDDVIM